MARSRPAGHDRQCAGGAGRADWTQRTIFHLHWEDAIYRHLSDSDTALEECRRFLDDAEEFIHEGGLFVWTIHNRAPHDGRYLEVHQQLCAKLAVLAQQVHVHSYTAGAELIRDRHLDRSKLVVIPHGNYAPIYARRRPPIRYTGEGRRFLLFGRLGRYKEARNSSAPSSPCPIAGPSW